MEDIMKKVISLLILLTFIIACGDSADDPDGGLPESGPEDYCPDLSYEKTFSAPNAFDQPFADADKDGDNDDKMCWAAAAANMLVWSGYAADEDDVFNIFKRQFPNEPGYLVEAVEYYLEVYSTGTKAENIMVREYETENVMDFIACALNERKSVNILIDFKNDNRLHYLTVYGYGDLTEERVKLQVADSDDKEHRLKIITFLYNEEGYWHNSYSSIKYALSMVSK